VVTESREAVTDKAEYQAAVLACHMAAKLLAVHDLPKILDAIARADAVGCFVDPTLYRERAPAMREDKQVIEDAMPLWRLGRSLHSEAT
jgi:hypothetical protein